MSGAKTPSVNRRREPLSDAQLLMLISICIFAAMYLFAIFTMGSAGFSKPQMFFDLLNEKGTPVEE